MHRALVFFLAVSTPLTAAWAGCAPIAFGTPSVWRAAAVDDTVEITFLGHASFEIVSPAGVRAVTDYNGINLPADPPDIASMNHAHATHYTLEADPRISHTERYGNSIFVFETGGLCIAHLGHLHHLLEPSDLNTLGHIDVVMEAVDGGWTMSQQDAAAVVEQLQPRIVLPMHYFNRDVLTRFLDLERGRYVIDVRESAVLDVSRACLPPTPTVIVLPNGL